MSIWSAMADSQRRGKCKRCHRNIIIHKEGQEYGPKCARILAGQVQLDSQALVSGKVLRRTKAPQKERKCRVCGCTELTACPGGCSWIEQDLCSACDLTPLMRKRGLLIENADESAVAAYRGAVLA